MDRVASPAFSVNTISHSAIWSKPRLSSYSLRASPAASVQLHQSLSSQSGGLVSQALHAGPQRLDSFADGDDAADRPMSFSDGSSKADDDSNVATGSAASDSCMHRFWFQFRLLAFQHAAAIVISLHLISALSAHVLCGTHYGDFATDGLFSSASRASAVVVCYSLHSLQVATLVGALHTLIDALSKGMIKPFALVHVAFATIVTMSGIFTICFFHSPTSFSYLVSSSSDTTRIESAFDFADSASPSLTIFLVFTYFSTTTFCTIGFGGACMRIRVIFLRPCSTHAFVYLAIARFPHRH